MVKTKLWGLGISIAAALLLAMPAAWAQTATNLKCKGCVGTRDLHKGAVTTNRLKGGAVRTSKIANGAVTEAKLNRAVILPLKVVDANGLFVGHMVSAFNVLIHTADATFILELSKTLLGSNFPVRFEDMTCTTNPFILNTDGSNSAMIAPPAASAGAEVFIPTGPASLFDGQSLLQSDGSCDVDLIGLRLGSAATPVANYDPTTFVPPFEVRR